MKNLLIILSIKRPFWERFVFAFSWLFMGKSFYKISKIVLDRTTLYRHTKGVWLNPLTSWRERKDILENSMPQE